MSQKTQTSCLSLIYIWNLQICHLKRRTWTGCDSYVIAHWVLFIKKKKGCFSKHVMFTGLVVKKDTNFIWHEQWRGINEEAVSRNWEDISVEFYNTWKSFDRLTMMPQHEDSWWVQPVWVFNLHSRLLFGSILILTLVKYYIFSLFLLSQDIFQIPILSLCAWHIHIHLFIVLILCNNLYTFFLL